MDSECFSFQSTSQGSIQGSLSLLQENDNRVTWGGWESRDFSRRRRWASCSKDCAQTIRMQDVKKSVPFFVWTFHESWSCSSGDVDNVDVDRSRSGSRCDGRGGCTRSCRDKYRCLSVFMYVCRCGVRCLGFSIYIMEGEMQGEARGEGVF